MNPSPSCRWLRLLVPMVAASGCLVPASPSDAQQPGPLILERSRAAFQPDPQFLERYRAAQQRRDPAAPQLDPAAPQLDPAVPRLDPAAPRLDPVAPQPDPAAPRLDPAAPRLDPTAPQSGATAPRRDPIAPQRRDPIDPIAEELRAAEIDRDAAFRELEARRAEYHDALRRTEQLNRREAMRPSFVNPYLYGVDPIAAAEAYQAQSMLAVPRPSVLRPVSPLGGVGTLPVGPGPYPFGRLPITPVNPYGYGYGYGVRTPGGLDIPFGFGLGGLSIRW